MRLQDEVVSSGFCIFDKAITMDIQLKEKLIAKIGSTNDDELLRQLLRVLDLESKTDEYYSLSEDEKEAVNEGIAQLDKDVFLSNEEANHQADQCLNK